MIVFIANKLLLLRFNCVPSSPSDGTSESSDYSLSYRFSRRTNCEIRQTPSILPGT